MSDTSLDTAGVIAAGTFSETEQNGINKGGDTFYVSRSSFSISNFIVHRYALLDESVFVYLSYLQSKKFTMKSMRFEMTELQKPVYNSITMGKYKVAYSVDPLEIEVDDIYMDHI